MITRSRRLLCAVPLVLLLPLQVNAESRWEEFKRRAGGLWGRITDEVRLLPGTVANLPGAYVETATDGTQLDGLEGLLLDTRDAGRWVVDEAREVPQWLPHLPQGYMDSARSGEQLHGGMGYVQELTDDLSLGLLRVDLPPESDAPEHLDAYRQGQDVAHLARDEILATLGTAGLARGQSSLMRHGGDALDAWRARRGQGLARQTPAEWEAYLAQLERRQSLSRRSGGGHPTPDEVAAMPPRQVAPGEIRYSQSTVDPNVHDYEAFMREGGWFGEPIDVVRMPDGTLTSLDNRRLMAAQRAGLDDIPVRVHEPGAALPEAWADGRFSGASTYEDAVRLRTGKQGMGYPEVGNFTEPAIATERLATDALYPGEVVTQLPTPPGTPTMTGATAGLAIPPAAAIVGESEAPVEAGVPAQDWQPAWPGF